MQTNLNSVGGKAEALLNHRGQLADTATLLSQNVLRASGEDDDLSTLRSGANLNTRVAKITRMMVQGEGVHVRVRERACWSRRGIDKLVYKMIAQRSPLKTSIPTSSSRRHTHTS